MTNFLVTLTNTETWVSIKHNVPANDEAHALQRALLLRQDLNPEHNHHMTTISQEGANPSAIVDQFDYISEDQIEVLERIDHHIKHPLLER